MKDFLEIVFGNLTVGSFLGYLLLTAIGAIFHLYMEVKERNKDSKRTPYHFSWQFFRLDNVKRLLRTIILIVVCVRFFDKITGTELSAWSAFISGMALDRVSQFWKKKEAVIKQFVSKIFKTTGNDNQG